MAALDDHNAIEPNAYAIAFRMIGNPERSAVVSWETANFVSSIGGLANPFWLAETAAEAVRLSLLRPPADSGDVQLRDSIRRRLAAAAPEELAASSLFHLAGYPIEDVATALSVDVTSARRYAQLLSPPPGVTYKHLGDPALIGEDEVEPEPVVDAGTMADRKARRTRWVRSTALLLAGAVAVAVGAALSVGDRPTLESGATTASSTGAPPSPVDASSAAVRAPTGCSNERPPSGVATVPITAGSGTYRLAIPQAPTGVNANDAAPLLIAVPGYGQSAQSFVDTTQLEAQGVASGVVVATYDPAEPALEVNTVGDPERPDDLDGVAAMLDDVRSKVCVDPSQVHLVGFGPGAQLAGQLACRRSAEVSSVAAVSGGALPEDCNLDPPVSSLLLWNADDDVLPVAGGYGPSIAVVAPSGADAPRPTAEAAESLASRWASTIGSTESSRSAEGDGTTVADFTGGRNGAEVRLVIAPTGGHAWSAGATDSILEFVGTHFRSG